MSSQFNPITGDLIIVNNTSGGGGSGTVTSVALADGSSTPIFSISGSPVTGSGTLTETLLNQAPNTVFAGPSVGGIDSFTQLLLHLDGNFTDSSSYTQSVSTALGTGSYPSGKFGQARTTTSGAYPYLANYPSAFNLGSGDFTFDFWAKATSLSASAYFVSAGIAGTGQDFAFRVISDGTIYWDFGSLQTTSGAFITDGNFHHYAMVRFGNVHKIYIDGVVAASGTFSHTYAYTSTLNLSFGGVTGLGDNLVNFTGSMDEIRISIGVARWTANFTPPAAPYASLEEPKFRTLVAEDIPSLANTSLSNLTSTAVNVDIVPTDTSATLSLGSSSNPWGTIHVNLIDTNLSGNAVVRTDVTGNFVAGGVSIGDIGSSGQPLNRLIRANGTGATFWGPLETSMLPDFALNNSQLYIGGTDNIAHQKTIIGPGTINNAGKLILNANNGVEVFSNTSLLLHFDNSLTDSSLYNHILTNTGGVPFSNDGKFGQCVGFDGTNYLSTPADDSFNFGNEDFTIEFQIKVQSNNDPVYPLMRLNSSGAGEWMAVYSSNKMSFIVIPKSGPGITATPSSPDNLNDGFYHHCAFVRDGSTIKVFIDGIQTATGDSSISGSVTFDPTIPLGIGRIPGYTGAGNNFVGEIDEIRISKGIARWTSNFTPPSSPYVADEQESLILTPTMKSGLIGLLSVIDVTGSAQYFSSNVTSYTALPINNAANISYSPYGLALAPASNVPAIYFPYLPAGEYEIVFSGAFNVNGLNKCLSQWKLTDGTNFAREILYFYTDTVSTLVLPELRFTMRYDTAQTNITLTLQGIAPFGGDLAIPTTGATGVPFLNIKTYYNPLLY